MFFVRFKVKQKFCNIISEQKRGLCEESFFMTLILWASTLYQILDKKSGYPSCLELRIPINTILS